MLSRKNEDSLMTIATYARQSNSLLTIVSNDAYPTHIRRIAARNSSLNTDALHLITNDMYAYDKEVLYGVLENPNISRRDIVSIARHHDLDIAKAALSTRPGLSSNMSVLNEFIYSYKIELSDHAVQLGLKSKHYELAKEIYEKVQKESDSKLVEIGLRSISDPLVCHILSQYSDERIVNALSKSHYLSPSTIESILEIADTAIMTNLVESTMLSPLQMERIANHAIATKDMNLYSSVLRSPLIGGELLDEMLEKRRDFYEHILDKSLPYLSEETKESVMNELEVPITEALERNPALSHDMINTQYGISLSAKSGHEGPDVLQYFESNRDDLNLLEVYNDFCRSLIPDYEVNELLRLADQEDIDPDLKKTIMLGLLNQEGQTIETLNRMQSVFDSGEGLVNMIGTDTINYKKNASTYLSNRHYSMIAKVRMTMHTMSQKVEGVRDSINQSISKNLSTIKSQIPTIEMTDMNVPRIVIDKLKSGVKQIRNIKKKDKGRNQINRSK